MKRSLSFLCLLLWAFTPFAQNVGVGETSPVAKLTVRASDAFSKSLLLKTNTNDTTLLVQGFNHHLGGGFTNLSSSALTINNKHFLPFDNSHLTLMAWGERAGSNANGSLSTLEFRNINGGSARYTLSAYLGAATTHSLNLYHFNPVTGITRPLLFFNEDGDSGLGTFTPTEKLDVIGNIRNTGTLAVGTNATVGGNINVVGEVNRTATGTSNMVPIAYGNISAAGFIQHSSGNITVSRFSAGVYLITITGESYQFQQYVTVVTTIGSGSPTIATTGSGGGQLQVYTWNTAGAATDVNFHFVVYQQ